MSRRLNPRKLTRIATKTVNNYIRCKQDIDALHIPRTLQCYVDKYYFADNLWCDEKLPPIDMDDYPYDHQTIFCRLSIDEFLSMQRYKGVPWFAFGKTHIKREWYEINNNNEPICYYCMANHTINIKGHYSVYKFSSCYVEVSKALMNEIQGLDMWCSNCFTTSLFSLGEYTFKGIHYSEDRTRRCDYVHYIHP